MPAPMTGLSARPAYRRRADPGRGAPAAGCAGSLSHVRRGRRGALCRQGAIAEEARGAVRAKGAPTTSASALMIDLTRVMAFTTTRTEADALLLEINLIKQLKPRFNVLLRDDKSFPEIVIRREHPAAQLRKHRGAHAIKGDYFGPFASAWAVNRTLNTLQKAFLLRSCSDSVFESRTRPVHAAPDQALQRAVRRADLARRLRRPRRGGRSLPARQEPGRDRADGRGNAAGLRRHGVRARRGLARPHPRPGLGGAGDPDQPREPGGGRSLRPLCRGRSGLRPGVLLPRRPELGQPGLLPARRPRRRRRGDHGRLPRPVLRRAAGPEPAARQPSRRPSASCWPRPSASRRDARSRSSCPERARSAA